MNKMNKKEKELIGILKVVIIPQLIKNIEEDNKKMKELIEENNFMAWYYNGLILGEERHLKELENIIRWFEGNKKDENDKEE